MTPNTTSFVDSRLPDYPGASLTLDGLPLSIYKENSFTTLPDASSPSTTKPQHFSVPIGIATILYHWHPTALLAFLDLDAWFSLTWSVTLPSGSKREIGRVGSQITFGTLDPSGENWEVMLTYNIAVSDENFERGKWVPNTRESMLGEKDITSKEEVARLGAEWVEEMVAQKRWEAGKGVKHSFHVEYAPMDIFGDGIPMSPHWLYSALDLGKCTTCGVAGRAEKPLNRCGRCGTAAYCSAECQKGDWKVHKWVCTMSAEDRGMAIKISEKGGLYKWDVGRTMVGRDEEVESENPHFEEVQFKRQKSD